MRPNSVHGFDHTTAAGQIRLMRMAVGQDYDFSRRIPPASGPGTGALREPRHPLVGRKVSSRWLFGPEDCRVTRRGVVSHVSPTTGGALRLAVVDESGEAFRCYISDPQWDTEVES